MSCKHPGLSTEFKKSILTIDRRLALPNFGIVKRRLSVCGMDAVLYFTEGLCDMSMTQRVLSFCMGDNGSIPAITDAQAFANRYIPYAETEISDDADTLHLGVSTGCLLLLISAFPQSGILIKSRNVPTRSLDEPEHDKVLRGAHIGFVETLARNCSMIRRLLPSTDLVMKNHLIGTASKTNVVLCYMKGRADDSLLAYLEKRLSEITADTLCLGTQSVAECLVKKRVWNPFPRFRYTERPDTAAASIAEGSILLLCENAPQAMILPVSIFSFLQETNDFYLAPFTGTYLRILRLITYLLSIYLIPTWYAIVTLRPALPGWLAFLSQTEASSVPILIQLLLIELAVDGLKLASMNTPNALSNSLSVIGGLILGDFAIEVGWFMPETILYMAVVTIAHFTQHNYELGYAFKYVRVAMLLLVAVFGFWGILLGTVLMILLLITTPTAEEKRRYFYPLIPFNGPALFSLFFRRRKEHP
ncbi:MAG: spore germination protein [Clostridia bacterium]|nr:spore germination protein [Clostridia bacterium]